MKVLALVLALACAASAVTLRGAHTPEQIQHLRQKLGKTVIKALLPALPADLVLEPVNIDIDSSLVTAVVSLLNGHALGLDSLTDTLKLNLLALTVTGDVDIPKVQIVGDYTASGQVRLTEGTFDIEGAGALDVTVTGIKVQELRIKINLNLITQKVSIGSLSLTPSITAASGAATGATANGEPIDWPQVGADAPAAIDKYWAESGDDLTEEIRVAVNELIKDLTLQDLIDLISGGGKP